MAKPKQLYPIASIGF